MWLLLSVMNSSQIEAIIYSIGGRVLALDELATINSENDLFLIVNTDYSNQVKWYFILKIIF